MEKLLLVCSVFAFVMGNSGLLTAGILPISPKDGVLLLLLPCLPLALLLRTQFTPALLSLAILPVARILDAGLLQRYHLSGVDGNHMAAVVQMLPPIMHMLLILHMLQTRMMKLFVIWGGSCFILLNCGNTLYEWMGWAHWTSVPLRYSGWLGHPNSGPTFSLFCLTAIFVIRPKFWPNMLLAAVTLLPTAVSLSRSCAMMYMTIVGLYVLLHFRQHWRGILCSMVIAPMLVGLWINAVQATATKGRIRPDEFTEGRFEAIYKMDVQGLKSQERHKDLTDAWDSIWREPTWGQGSGTTRGEPWQPHNQIISVWLELGLFGVIFYLAQILLPLCLWLMQGCGRVGWVLLPTFLNIPCQQWLFEMPTYWLCLGVAYLHLFPRRLEFRLNGQDKAQAATALA